MTKDNTDPKRWIMKLQTQVKHEILDYYLKAYMVILGGRKPTNFNFIDGFAGRGVYESGEPGSPIIAMKTGQELFFHTRQNARLKIFAIEVDVENFSSLKNEVDKSKPLCPDITVQLYCSSFNKEIDSILSKIDDRQNVFVFIDPFGYEGVEIETVIKIMQRPNTEVFLTFMSSFVNRFLSVEDKAVRMNKLFGGDEWANILKIDDTRTQEKVLRLYCSNLLKMASERNLKGLIVFPVGIKQEGKLADIYHLIHLSKNPKARLEMERAVLNKGSASLEGVKLKTIGMLELGMRQQEMESIVLNSLQKNVAKEAIKVAGNLWFSRWEDGLTWRVEIRQILLNLENIGAIKITPSKGVRKIGLAINEYDLVSLNN